MLLMKKQPAKTKARKVVDAPIDTLRLMVSEVQRQIDAIATVLDEADAAGRDNIRCEPKSLGKAAEFAGKTRRSIEGYWDKNKPRPY